MNIQQFDEKMITITQLRRDIDILDDVLRDKEEALIMRNQDIMFIAVTPEKYQKMKSGIKDRIKIENAVRDIDTIRRKYGKVKKSVSDYVIKMRDERITKWRR